MNADKIIQNILALSFVKDFSKQFPESGLYLVGGAIRDLIMGVECKDLDIVVENVNFDQLCDFLVRYGQIKLIESRAFGVIKFRPKINCHSEPDSESQRSRNKFGMTGGKECLIFDVALARKEEYTPGMRKKHTKIEHGNITIIDDLTRRDFTMNAIALCLSSNIEYRISKQIPNSNFENSKLVSAVRGSEEPSGSRRDFGFRISKLPILDPYHGLDDIKNKLIRAVGDPEERFLEDPTRILRAIRLALKLNFQIESETKKAMIKLAREVIKKFKNQKGRLCERVSYEIIGQEFVKTFNINPEKTISLYDEIGLLELIIPEMTKMKGVKQPDIFHTEGDVFDHTLLTLRNLPEDTPLSVKLAALLHDIGKPATFVPAEKAGGRIRFHDHDKIGQELSAGVLKRIKMPKKLIDEVGWLVREHMKIFFAFPQMKRERQKALVRNPLFDQLLVLARADTYSSLRPNGQPDLGIMPKIEKIAESIKEEDRRKPLEIINGHEIIKIIQKIKPDFNPEKEGKKIGKLKKEINSLYDRGEIRTQKEALKKLDQLI